ncbi:MAG: prepilin-type N-terminal cleavage/methylation domain-containing protein [Elusimicrobiaceae bacterium]|nr:prepilin-type N-terminal cleavage/methylation domain-containing protein [Elusimicrobiaceae bacterium]
MKKGFTLVELLVVVLIIGILSAVALPQYNLAVKKTRTMALLPLIKAIDTAESVYYMETGEYTDQWDNLSIEMPGGATLSGNMLNYKNFRCYFYGFPDNGSDSQSVYCNSLESDVPQIEKYFASNQYICWASKNSLAEKICKSISGKSTSDTTGKEGMGRYNF